MEEIESLISVTLGGYVGVNYHKETEMVLFSCEEGGHQYSIEIPKRYIENAKGHIDIVEDDYDDAEATD